MFSLSRIYKSIIMERKPKSVKIIYWITNIVFWIFAIASFIGFVFGIAIVFGFLNKTQLHIGMPLGMDITEIGLLELNGQKVDVQLKEMYGKLHLIDAPKEISRVYGVFILIILSVVLYILMTFKKFITNVYHGAYFDRGNIFLLKRISYALVGVWLFAFFYTGFQYFYLFQNIEFTTVVFSGNFQTYPAVLIVALLIWVLSHIFQKGVELQSDHELTI